MIRIHVPKLDMLKGFDPVDRDERNRYFDAIKELTDPANIVETANQIALGQYEKRHLRYDGPHDTWCRRMQ